MLRMLEWFSEYLGTMMSFVLVIVARHAARIPGWMCKGVATGFSNEPIQLVYGSCGWFTRLDHAQISARLHESSMSRRVGLLRNRFSLQILT